MNLGTRAMYLTASSRIGQDERLAIDRNRRAGDHVVCERLDQVRRLARLRPINILPEMLPA